jgi:serine/threonine protein kinase
MLASLRPKYRHLFLSVEGYRQKGIILSDEILLRLEDTNRDLPLPTKLPNFRIGEKLGEGSSSETYLLREHLGPVDWAVQFHPLSSNETFHLACVSALMSQLYALSPHVTPFLGYYLAPAREELRSPCSSSDSSLEIGYHAYGFIYERVPLTLEGVYCRLKKDSTLARFVLAQLFFIVKFLQRYGFNHGDISLSNLGWIEDPSWQGRSLDKYNYYAYLVEDVTYYLPVGPIIRLLDYEFTSYQDEVLTLETSYGEDDMSRALEIARDFLSQEEYEALEESPSAWTNLFSNLQPQPGDKIIVIGYLPSSN